MGTLETADCWTQPSANSLSRVIQRRKRQNAQGFFEVTPATATAAESVATGD